MHDDLKENSDSENGDTSLGESLASREHALRKVAETVVSTLKKDSSFSFKRRNGLSRAIRKLE